MEILQSMVRTDWFEWPRQCVYSAVRAESLKTKLRRILVFKTLKAQCCIHTVIQNYSGVLPEV